MTGRFSLSTVVALLLAAGLCGAGEARAQCTGDCNGDGRVAVDELVVGVNLVLGNSPLDVCPSFDADGDGQVSVDEMVLAVENALAGCAAGGAVFVIRACAGPDDPDGQTFRALIRDPATIAEAEALIGAGSVQIISGSLRAGDGGFNEPWSWHLDPATIDFADLAIEVCDGCPMFVEEDLDYWLDVVGQYCPWSTEVVARQR